MDKKGEVGKGERHQTQGLSKEISFSLLQVSETKLAERVEMRAGERERAGGHAPDLPGVATSHLAGLLHAVSLRQHPVGKCTRT